MKKTLPESAELVKRVRRSLTRISRFTNRLQRSQLSCGPVTVQQCYTLEALVDGSLPMNELADEVALHQSTLTRIVEKLEEKNLVTRQRSTDNLRKVEVSLTESGKHLYSEIDAMSNQMIGSILALVPEHEKESITRGLEVLCDLLDPRNTMVQQMISGCCCNDRGQTKIKTETENE